MNAERRLALGGIGSACDCDQPAHAAPHAKHLLCPVTRPPHPAWWVFEPSVANSNRLGCCSQRAWDMRGLLARGGRFVLWTGRKRVHRGQSSKPLPKVSVSQRVRNGGKEEYVVL